MPTTVPRRFAGFDRDTLDLFGELEENNNTDWFQAHRAEFREQVVEPAIDLVTEMGPLLRARVSPGLRAEPRVGGSVVSMRKDARHVGDQPFRTCLELRFWEGLGASSRHPAFFVRIGAEQIVLGAGIALLPPDLLLHYRERVDRPDTGRELARLLHRLGEHGAQVSGQRLRRVPRPYPMDHERAGLLKHVGLLMERIERLPGGVPEAVVGPILPELLVSAFVRLAPVWRWLRALEE